VAEEPLPGAANYLLSNDPARWRTGVPTYGKVRYKEIYPGTDLVYYGNEGQLEYDFVVAPGADPTAIALRWDGADRLELDAAGDLLVHTAGGTLRQQGPLIYQEVDDRRVEIAGRHVLLDAERVGFDVGAYDASRPLVIDPTLTYSTFLGGSGADQSRGIAVDASGNVYVAGGTTSTNFPTANPRQPANAGGEDAFVAKLNPQGTALIFSTYLGGSGTDFATGVALDNAGSLYLAPRSSMRRTFPIPFRMPRSARRKVWQPIAEVTPTP
jgi:hypothetical protein